MKKIFPFLIFIFCGSLLFAQEKSLLTAEQMPVFPGGEQGMKEYLIKNIHYPEAAKATAKEGVCYVNFVVTATGEVRNAKVLKPVDENLDNEALRVVNAMPAWQPGMQDGKAVSVQYNLPIRFTLDVADKKKGK
jgi:TonB family protein